MEIRFHLSFHANWNEKNRYLLTSRFSSYYFALEERGYFLSPYLQSPRFSLLVRLILSNQLVPYRIRIALEREGTNRRNSDDIYSGYHAHYIASIVPLTQFRMCYCLREQHQLELKFNLFDININEQQKWNDNVVLIKTKYIKTTYKCIRWKIHTQYAMISKIWKNLKYGYMKILNYDDLKIMTVSKIRPCQK